MIISVDELRKFIETKKTDEVLEAELKALETSIRNHTNNNFQNINIRFRANASNSKLQLSTTLLKVGDSIQISQSLYNDGVYVIKEINNGFMTLDEEIIEEPKTFLITKVVYKNDVKMGVVEIMRWKLKNESQNYDENAKKEVQSETLSRHSVTYKQDTTESDINEKMGVPKKYCAFLRPYMKARFE